MVIREPEKPTRDVPRTVINAGIWATEWTTVRGRARVAETTDLRASADDHRGVTTPPDRRFDVRSPGRCPSRSATLSTGITLRPTFDPAPIGLVWWRSMVAGQVHVETVRSGGTGASCWSWRAIYPVHRARDAHDAVSHQPSATGNCCGPRPTRRPRK